MAPWAVAALALTLVYARLVRSSVSNIHLPQQLSAHFDWKGLSPSKNLSYVDCYDAFQCARLSVPLDWQNLSNPNFIDLAVIRLPATVPPSHPDHGGSIIINPGGPGGSGVLYALTVAKKMQKFLDAPQHYEIVSFDPRVLTFTA
jgi:hypothetical protein